MKAMLLTILLLACFALAVAFGSLNPQSVQLNYLLAAGEFKLSTLLGLFLAFGFFVGWLVGSLFYFKQRVVTSSLRQRVKQQAKEIETLRAIPLQDQS